MPDYNWQQCSKYKRWHAFLFELVNFAQMHVNVSISSRLHGRSCKYSHPYIYLSTEFENGWMSSAYPTTLNSDDMVLGIWVWHIIIYKLNTDVIICFLFWVILSLGDVHSFYNFRINGNIAKSYIYLWKLFHFLSPWKLKAKLPSALMGAELYCYAVLITLVNWLL